MKIDLSEIPFFEAINAFLDKSYLICINNGTNELYFRINNGRIDEVNVPLKYLLPKLGEISQREKLSPEETMEQHGPIVTRRYLEETLSILHDEGEMKPEDISKEIKSGRWCKLDKPIYPAKFSGIDLYHAVVRPKLSEYKAAGIPEEDLNRLFSDFATT